MKLEIYNCFPDTTPRAKFQGRMSTWVVWANIQFDAWKFVLFFCSSSRPQVASLDTAPRTIRYYTSFPPRKCLSGVRKMKFEMWPPLPLNNVNIWTSSWWSIGNCSRPNYGTVSRIHFKLGTGIDHPSDVTWHDYKVKRSKVKVTT